MVAVDSLGSAPVNTAGHQGLFYERLDGQGLAAGATGFYYNRNRFYSPALGRFLQRDPNETAMPLLTAMVSNGGTVGILLGAFDAQAHFGTGMNVYLYLGSNPLHGYDPMGLMSCVDGTIAQGEGLWMWANMAQSAIRAGRGAMALAQQVAGMAVARAVAYSLSATVVFNATIGSDGATCSEIAFELSRAWQWMWDAGYNAFATNSGQNFRYGMNDYLNRFAQTGGPPGDPEEWNRLQHTFMKHGPQYFGVPVDKLTPAQLKQWADLIDYASRCQKTFQWSSEGTPTIARLVRLTGGKWFCVQHFVSSGRLATAFVPNTRQLPAMLDAMKGG